MHGGDEGEMDDMNDMEVMYGTPVGHYLAGSIFVLFALHWSWAATRLILTLDPQPSRASYPICGRSWEPQLRLLAIIIGYIFELYVWEEGWGEESFSLWHPLHLSDGRFAFIDAWTHCTM